MAVLMSMREQLSLLRVPRVHKNRQANGFVGQKQARNRIIQRKQPDPYALAFHDFRQLRQRARSELEPASFLVRNGRPLLNRLPLGSRLRHVRSEEHTSELQSHSDLVCRLLLE